MGKSRYKLTGGKKNGFASFPKTLVEAIFWDKKKQPLEEVLDGKIDQPLDPAYVGKVPQVAQDGTVDWVVPLAGSTADSAMSDSSTNAPQNKVVKAYVDEVGAEVSQLGQEVGDISRTISDQDFGESIQLCDKDNNLFAEATLGYNTDGSHLTIKDDDDNVLLSLDDNGLYVGGRKLYPFPCVIVDANGGGDYSTISAAIAGTQDGDTILVMPGVYTEHINMYNKERHLVGLCRDSVIVTTHDGLRSNNPCNANVGSIENMTFIAQIDDIPDDYYERPSIDRSCYAIHIDTQYTSSAHHEIVIRNCKLISHAHAGIGIGCRYNQTIKIIDCELITSVTGHGGFLMHNDDFNPGEAGGEVIVNNCYCEGKDTAVTISSVNNGALCDVSFINTTCYGTTAGVTGIVQPPTNHKWGQDISLFIISHGNNIADLNY